MLPSTAWILGIGAVIVGGAFFVSERAVTDPAGDRTTVIYWEKWTGQEGAAMRAIVDDFNKSQDRIFVKMLTISAVNDKTLLAASGGNPPDVAGMWGEQIVQFAECGAAMDLSDFAKEKGITSSMYIPVYWDYMNVHGRIFAFPTTPATTALHVRRDLVPADVASPETFPKDLDSFDKLVERISKKDSDGKLKLAGFMPSEPGWWNWAWGSYFGGSLMDNQGNLTIDSDANVKGFDWMAGYAKRYGAQQMQAFQSGFGNFSSPQNAFMEGKVASEVQGVWMGNYINNYKMGLDWFAVPFPYPTGHPEFADTNFANFDTMMIPVGAKHPKEAFEFIAFVQTQKEMEKLCTSHGKNSPLTAVSEGFLKNHPNKFIRLFDRLARVPTVIHPPKVGIWPEVSAEINTAVQEMNLGQKSAKEALHDAQVRMTASLSRYKRFIGAQQ